MKSTLSTSARTMRIALAALGVLMLVATGFYLRRHTPGTVDSSASPQPPSRYAVSEDRLAQVRAIEEREKIVRQTVWAKEVLAQHCGQTLERLWDRVNASTNRLLSLSEAPLEEIILGNWTRSRALGHGITLRQSDGAGKVLESKDWRRFLRRLDSDGWRLGELEFRHELFEPDSGGQPKMSVVYSAAQLTHEPRQERVLLEGHLRIEWKPSHTGEFSWSFHRVDSRDITLKQRRGRVPFLETWHILFDPPRNAYSADPLLVYDLDNDGVSELILVARNLVCRRTKDGTYQTNSLCLRPAETIFTAVLADLDRDGQPDLLCATLKGLELFHGSPVGRFDQAARLVWPAPTDWEYPMTMTCGDVDRDGDLDVFVAQYRVPYEDDSLPHPYYDALDGYPAFLLSNDGTGQLANTTELSGLAPKRHRRTYSASLVDLNGDLALDLAVVSDFAGIDLYENDGAGRFTDRTDAWIPEPHAFGMSHTLADFNSDGLLDVLMLGMPSATVDRLQHLGLWRTQDPAEREMRARMSWGNRLYYKRLEPGYIQNTASRSLARSGWSWGSGALDFDNDGWTDLYIVNGMESRASVRDYESEYWLHDRFVGQGRGSRAVGLYLQGKSGRTRGQGESYGGYERNRFFWNQAGRSFTDVGHLLGLGSQEDGRNVVADDLNGDGRVDLVATGYEAWPDPRLALHVFENHTRDVGHWIGFRFKPTPGGESPIGIQVTFNTPRSRQTAHIVTGDSYRSQRPASVHFGLGLEDLIGTATIRWPSGKELLLHAPATDLYHVIEQPSIEQAPRSKPQL